MPLTIVAEVGSNWWRPNPEDALESALAHVRSAARCGATAVKFQLFRADSWYSREQAPEQWERARRLELPVDWLGLLREEARAHNLAFWLTPFSPELVNLAAQFADVVKVSSGDLTYMPLLQAIPTRCVVALSTGMADQEEVWRALATVMHCRRTILMYCVSNYPADPAHYSLNKFPWSDTVGEMGVSDHTLGNELVIWAIESGYTVFEKHFTAFERGMAWDIPAPETLLPDLCVSMSPSAFAQYCDLLRHHFENRYRSGFGDRADEAERVWARRGPDGLRPNLSLTEQGVSE